MIISCSSCGAKYLVDPVQIGNGRQVRCARCNFSWFQENDGLASNTKEVSNKIISKRDTQSDKNLPAVYKERSSIFQDTVVISFFLLFIIVALAFDQFNKINPLEVIYIKASFFELFEKIFVPK